MTIAYHVADFLRDHHIPYELVPHERTSTSLQSARASHVPAHALVKAVVLEADSEPIMVLLPADRMVSIDALEAHLGKAVTLADEQVLSGNFADCALGAVPATGASYGMRTFWDETLADDAFLYFEAGDHEELVRVPGDAFCASLDRRLCGSFSRPIL